MKRTRPAPAAAFSAVAAASALVRRNATAPTSSVPISAAVRSRLFPPPSAVRAFAVKINVGHGPGPGHQPSSPSQIWPGRVVGSNVKRGATGQQKKSAALELERMAQTTDKILATDLANSAQPGIASAALINEVRVAFTYWTSRWYTHHHPRMTSTPTVPTSDQTGARTAERLLDWIVDADRSLRSGNDLDAGKKSSSLVDRIIGVDGNAPLLNLMEAYFFSTDSESGLSSLNQSNKVINVDAWLKAIDNAARVHGKVEAIFADPSNKLRTDTLSVNTDISILSKVCAVLSAGGQLGEDVHTSLAPALVQLKMNVVVDDPDGPLTFTIDDVIRHMELILVDAERNWYRTHDSSICPDVCTYNTIIGSIARSDLPNAAKRAEEYLIRMEKAEDSEFNPTESSVGGSQYAAIAAPDVVTYNSVLNGYASTSAPPPLMERSEATPKYTSSNMKRAEEILQRLEERYARTNRQEVQADTISFSTLLQSYANMGDAVGAERLLDHMTKLSTTEGWVGRVQPNTICFNSVLHSLSKSKEADAGHRAEELLRRMENLAESSPELNIVPDKISYCAAIAAWARSSAEDGAERAEALLERSIEQSQTGIDAVTPDIVTFNAVLDAWAKHSAIREGRAAAEAAQRAESLLDEIEQNQRDGIQPGVISYNIVIDAWAKCGVQGSEQRAEKILRRMPAPDEISYNNVIRAYATSRQKGGLDDALRLLQEMEATHIPITPTSVTYNLIMDALVRRGDLKSVKRAEEILVKMEKQFEAGNEMVQPNGISYNICINGFAKSGDPRAGEHAERLLKRMTVLSDKWDAAALSPDIISFTSVIDSYANSATKEGAERAEKMLGTMMSTNSSVSPNRVTFNSVLNAIAKGGAEGSAEKALAILKQMETLYEEGNDDVRPDDVTYSSLFNVLARSGEEDAAERAEVILNRLESLSEEGRGYVKPNAFCYSSVLNAWARSKKPDAPQRALELLNRMENMFQSGLVNAKPNSFCYNAVINAFAKSSFADKAKQSQNILHRMLENYHSGSNRDCKPSVMTYSTVLNACAYTTGTRDDRDEAFHIARTCLKELLSSDTENPNCVAFSTFLLACARLVPRGPDRDMLTESVFRECCKQGQVDELVIRNLRTAASHELFAKMLGRGNVSWRSLPDEWKRGLKYRGRRN